MKWRALRICAIAASSYASGTPIRSADTLASVCDSDTPGSFSRSCISRDEMACAVLNGSP